MDHALKRKVAVQFNHHVNDTSCPASPNKALSPTLRPTAKVNSAATIRRTASAISPVASTSNGLRVNVTPSTPEKGRTTPRAGSPYKASSARAIKAAPSSITRSHSTKSSTSTSSKVLLQTPELRQRALNNVPSDPSLKQRTGGRTPGSSFSLHHTQSFQSFHGRSTSSDATPNPVVSPNAYNSPSSRPGSSAGLSPASALSSVPGSPPSDILTNSPGVMMAKVKAKVSGLAKQVDSTPSFTPYNRARTVSVSSNSPLTLVHSPPSTSFSPPTTQPVFYPITTAVPAANPHRFATARASPPASNHYHYQPFAPSHTTTKDDSSLAYKGLRRTSIGLVNGANGQSAPNSAVNGTSQHFDPSSIPLPLHSPPLSAVSFSSRSSASKASSRNPAHSNDSLPSSAHGSKRNSMVGTRPVEAEDQNEEEEEGEEEEVDDEDLELDDTHAALEGVERKFKAEAKSIRKIADLEITNRSLLAINASLESARHRQAKEIRELKKRLRESRLLLPPKTFRAVQKLEGETVDLDEDEDEEGDTAESEEEIQKKIEASVPQVPGQVQKKKDKGDETYRRCKLLLDTLIKSGKQALESKPEDHADFTLLSGLSGGRTRGGTKVLSADEVRDWRGEGPAPNLSTDLVLSPAIYTVPLPDSDDEEVDKDEEQEVAASLLRTSTSATRRPSSPIPPIRITEP